jgi:hypothetical protein
VQKNKCECCGLENHSCFVLQKKEGKTVWFEQDLTQWMRSGLSQTCKVVLTIAHLDQ